MQVELRRSGVEHAATSSTARFTRTGGGICPPGLRATQIMRGTMRMTATLRINNIAKILGVIASQPGRPRPLTQPGGARQALSRRSRSYRKRTARTLHWLSNKPLQTNRRRLRLRQRPAASAAYDLSHDPLSTKRREPGILVHVHPVLPRIAEASQLQLPRPGPDKSSHPFSGQQFWRLLTAIGATLHLPARNTKCAEFSLQRAARFHRHFCDQLLFAVRVLHGTRPFINQREDHHGF